jgi:chemotaxis protein methyltransferase CheR
MSEAEFARVSSFIQRELGIKMPPTKQVMLESRLSRRLRLRSMRSFGEYIDYVFSPEGTRTELIHMIDAVTTNKTDFFREADHFDYLLNNVLPAARPAPGVGGVAPGGTGDVFRLWSAGCSTGEEPYTLAMVLEEYRRAAPSFKWSILATDISSKVLEHAALAIYDEEKVAPVPYDYKKRYLLKSVDPNKRQVRVKRELRSAVEFRRLNFMDEDFSIRQRFDAVFCRNVIIYFDRTTQERLIGRFCDYLIPGGHLFLGHSETLTGMNLPLYTVAPTVYRKRGDR